MFWLSRIFPLCYKRAALRGFRSMLGVQQVQRYRRGAREYRRGWETLLMHGAGQRSAREQLSVTIRVSPRAEVWPEDSGFQKGDTGPAGKGGGAGVGRGMRGEAGRLGDGRGR
ncbi:hypothetical protein E2C01_042272 [Portunus trituberculatus]|uniref:Uncharacterized protein n=1 Tax=Portunus trituberculatus TaxID=210409 RepID=A0A5B7FT82_PORTR|nr:hypothetical protein [Portunus trituberculatus]